MCRRPGPQIRGPNFRDLKPTIPGDGVLGSTQSLTPCGQVISGELTTSIAPCASHAMRSSSPDRLLGSAYAPFFDISSRRFIPWSEFSGPHRSNEFGGGPRPGSGREEDRLPLYNVASGETTSAFFCRGARSATSSSPWFTGVCPVDRHRRITRAHHTRTASRRLRDFAARAIFLSRIDFGVTSTNSSSSMYSSASSKL